MSDHTQVKEETSETGFSLEGAATPFWSAVATWFAFVGLLALCCALMGCFDSKRDSGISPEGNLVLMYIIGIMTTLLALMAARMVMTSLSNRLYSRQLIETLGEKYLNVKLRNTDHLGDKSSPNAMRLSANTTEGRPLEISAFLVRESVTSSGTYCTYRLVTRPA